MMENNILILLITLLAVPCLASRVQQLPNDIIPVHYTLDLTLDTMDESNEYSGVVVIEVTSKKDTNLITLHVNLKMGLSIAEDSVTVRHCNVGDGVGLPGDAIVTKLSYDDENEWMILDTLDVSLIPWESYLIEIPFKGVISEKLLGLNKIKTDEGFIIASDFKRTYARNVFPCFDQPEMKATFEVTITCRKQDLPFSNGEFRETRFQEDDELAITVFNVTPILSTHQVAFIVVKRNLNDEIKINTSDRYKIKFHAVVGSKYLYTEIQGRIYTKRKQIDTSITSSVENFDRPLHLVWLILQTETKINIETLGVIVKREIDLDRAKEIGGAYSHIFTTEALARQVFASLVALRSWDSQWLILSQARLRAIQESDQVTNRNEILRRTLSVMKWDSLVGARKVNDIIDTGTNSLEQDVSEDVIDKGFVLINMIHRAIGEKRYDKALIKFYSCNINKAVSVDAFWNEIDETLEQTSTSTSIWTFYRLNNKVLIPENVGTSDIMKNWITQEGYPVLTVKRRGTDVFVSQSRFYSEIEQNKSPGSYCWWIPLTWTKKDDETDTFESTYPRAWLGCDSTKHPSTYTVTNVKPRHWIIFNNNMSGLYRVDYDKGSWKNIIDVLMDENKYKNVHCTSRVLLVSDVLAVALAGRYQTDFRVAFALASYLQHEQETSCLFVWESFFDGIEEYKKVLKKTPLYRDLEDFLQYILKPVYETRFPSELSVAGYIRKGVNVDHFGAQMRIHMESCQALVQTCLDHSTIIMQAWRGNKDNFNSKLSLFAKGLTESVLCSALRNSETTKDIDYVLDSLQAMGIENSNRDILSKSVSCLRNPVPTNRALTWCTEDTVNQVLEEKIAIFKDLLGGTFTYKEVAFYFFNNFERIKIYFSNQTRNPVPEFIKILACETDTDTVKMLKKFILKNGLEFMIKDEQLRECELGYERHQKWMKENELSLRESMEFVGKVSTKNRPM